VKLKVSRCSGNARRLLPLLPAVANLVFWAASGCAQVNCSFVTSAASFRAGMPAKGSIASIWCRNAQVQGIVLAETLPLPFELAGLKVWIGGAPAPLFGVAEGPGFQQLNVQVPQEATFGSPVGSQFVNVEIEQSGQRTPMLPVILSSPGEFFLWPGTNYGIFEHSEDGSLVTPEDPARPGETLYAYLTGMPETSPVVPTGQPAPSNPVAIVPQYNYPSALVDLFRIYETGEGAAANLDVLVADVPLAELVPGWVGVNRIKLVLRPSVGTGERQIVLVRSYSSHFPGESHTYTSSPVILPVR
jgi:uncharacterized protein (TIGR03437 family)